MIFRLLCCLALASSILAANSGVHVIINDHSTHKIPETLYGWMWEDINSGDGGLYAEMLQNRAFQQVVAGNVSALYGWTAVNGGSIEVVNNTKALSSALPNSLKLTVPKAAKGAVGVANSGYYGINVNKSWTYDVSFYYKFTPGSNFKGKFVISLVSSSGKTLASESVTVHGGTTSWTQIATKLKPSSSASNVNNTFQVVLSPSNSRAAGGETVLFSMFSLFPPTWKNKPNGMRMDLAQAIADTKPGIFRFPGGNNVGQTVATRWQWNNTVGPLIDRPGRMGDWGYVNTDGLGLMEYLDFIEEAGMQPIMAVFSGYTITGETVPADDMDPYVQQAIDQINFVIGDPSKSAPAALRAKLGRPEPYELHYVEIGNEDFFGTDTYLDYRWADFATKLTTTFPQLNFIATTMPFDPVLTPSPKYYDVHVYQTPEWFAENAFYYDEFERNGTKYFEGEYAAISTDAANLYGDRLHFPTVQSAIGEAAFMTGLERNSDIVFAAAYAPSLQHVNGSQWAPDLVSFTANEMYLSTSYYVQKMFSLSKGTDYLPSSLPTVNGTLYWSVTHDSKTSEVFIKVSNTAGTAAPITFTLPYSKTSSTGTAEILTGPETASNTPEAPKTVVPVKSTFKAGKTFSITVPAYSFSLLTLTAH